MSWASGIRFASLGLAAGNQSFRTLCLQRDGAFDAISHSHLDIDRPVPIHAHRGWRLLRNCPLHVRVWDIELMNSTWEADH